MEKQARIFTQLSTGLLVCIVAAMALFLSSCKKKEIPAVNPEVYYTVTFDSKGGSEVKAVNVKKGSTLTLPAAPTKASFIFDGWYTDKEASTSPFSATTTITSNLTLYAKWNAQLPHAEPHHMVTFDSKGGSEVKAVNVKKGGTITLPAEPTKTDFAFGGWFTDDNTFKNQFDATTSINADITLYAKWDVPDYTVTFDSKGGSEVKAVNVKKGGTITLPAEPTKTDFAFGGWFTDDNTFKNQFDAKTSITANLTLYAKWDVPDYTVTFDSKGGSEVKAVKVKKGGTITLPANPAKAGFTFGGWYTDDGLKNQFDAKIAITADLTLYAKWTAVATVVFSLSSTSFTDGGEIPPKYAYRTNDKHTDRLNVSPQLSWKNAPAATTSFLIIMEDLDVPGYPHWTAYNISADKTSLEENDPSLPTSPLGENGRYWGPFPPPPPAPNKHTYQITIFALDKPVTHFDKNNFPKSKADAEKKLGAHILASAFIKGSFESK